MLEHVPNVVRVLIGCPGWDCFTLLLGTENRFVLISLPAIETEGWWYSKQPLSFPSSNFFCRDDGYVWNDETPDSSKRSNVLSTLQILIQSLKLMRKDNIFTCVIVQESREDHFWRLAFNYSTTTAFFPIDSLMQLYLRKFTIKTDHVHYDSSSTVGMEDWAAAWFIKGMDSETSSYHVEHWLLC